MRVARPTVSMRYTVPDASAGGAALSNRSARGGSTIHGWPAVIVGLLVTAVGLGLAALMLGLVAPDAVRVNRDMPRWILALVGGLFAWAGVSVLVHGVAGLRRAARVRALRAAH